MRELANIFIQIYARIYFENKLFNSFRRLRSLASNRTDQCHSSFGFNAYLKWHLVEKDSSPISTKMVPIVPEQNEDERDPERMLNVEFVEDEEDDEGGRKKPRKYLVFSPEEMAVTKSLNGYFSELSKMGLSISNTTNIIRHQLVQSQKDEILILLVVTERTLE